MRITTKSTIKQNIENLFFDYETSISGIPVNEWGIPMADTLDADLSGVEWVNFNNREQIKDCKNTVIHFYCHDYQFNVVWSSPQKYLPLLKEARAVVAPDYSCYADMPMAMQLFQVYKQAWIVKYWQKQGIKVICNPIWAIGQLNDWNLSSIPRKTILATSLQIRGLDNEAMEMLQNELELITQLLQPTKLFIKCCDRAMKKLNGKFDFEQIPIYRFGLKTKV